MIPNETVIKILDTARIEEVVGDFVTLKRAGANYQACCPFHNEKTPSFVVSPSKGIFKCFGCGKSGTSVGFVMEHESMTYVEALRYLAKKYHIEIIEAEESAEEIAKRQRHESLLLVSEYAGKFFKDSLQTQEGQAVGYQYFRSRGLEDETIRKYGLGWGPSARTALADKAREEGYKEEFLAETGVCIQYDGGRLVDRFSDRVIFPIHSVSGRVIGFGGRTLRTDKSLAKYVNSPTSEIYDKRHTLYGIYFAKSEISRQDKCILVEGYLDVLSMHQLGITNVVASSGTSLTVEQIRLIRKFTNNVTIIYDGDSAGIKAALRGIGLVLKEGLNVKVILLPEGQDPDDFARRHTLDEVKEYIVRNEQDFINFKTDLLLGEAGNDPLKRAGLIKDIAETIALIPDAIIRAVYVKTCAEKFEMSEQLLTDSVNKSRSKMLIEDKKRQDRESQQMTPRTPYPSPADGPVPPDMPIPPDMPVPPDMPIPSDLSIPSEPVSEGPVFEEPSLQASERELLGFILEHGSVELKFDRDSKYYVEGESVTVAEFIDGTLAGDEAEFHNTPYRLVYDEYFRMYDENLSEEVIQKRLLDSMDPVVAFVAKDILIQKHQLTVKNYENSLTTIGTRLIQYVPKALIVYQSKKVELELKRLTSNLLTVSEEEQAEILAQITEMNRVRARLNNELGRV